MSPCSARIASAKHVHWLLWVTANLPSPNPTAGVTQSPSMPTCLQIVFKNRVNCPETILPADLLPFRVSPSAVRDSHFVHSAAFAGKLGDNFWLDAKTILFYLNRLNKWSAKGFVASFHVCQINVGEHVGEQCQKLVADHVPKEKNAMRSPTQEAGAQDGIRFSRHKGFQKHGIVFGTIFKVRVLYKNGIAGRGREPAAQGRSLAAIHRM